MLAVQWYFYLWWVFSGFRIQYLLGDAEPVCVVTNKIDAEDFYPANTKLILFDVLMEKSHNFGDGNLGADEKVNCVKENVFAVMYTSGKFSCKILAHLGQISFIFNFLFSLTIQKSISSIGR